MSTQPALDFTPRKTRADQVREAFEKYHAEHPQIAELFAKFTLEVIAAGQKHYSADAIFHRIRWHCAIDSRGEEVKINNNFSPYYARMFHDRHPAHKGFFRNRILTTKNRPPGKPNRQVFISPADDGEDEDTE